MTKLLRKTLTISLVVFSLNLQAQGPGSLKVTVQKFNKPVTDLRLISIEKKTLLMDLKTRQKPPRFDPKIHRNQYFESLKSDNGGWGGGTGVLRAAKAPILYDLYMSDPDLDDSYEITPNLPQTLFFKITGYEYVQVDRLAEYAATIQLLDSWRPKAYGLVSLLKESLKNLKLSHTSMPLQRIDGLVLAEPLQKGDCLEPIIVFNSMIGARINFTLWNKLGDRSRMGALIHEALRNYQINLSLHNREKEFDAKIQRITNLLIMQNPQNIDGHLDYTQFFDSRMLEYLNTIEFYNLSYQELIEIYRPHYLSDPVKRKKTIESFSDPAILASWEELRNKELKEANPFQIQKEIVGILTPQPEIAKFKELEKSVRSYLEGSSTNSSEDVRREVEIKALRLTHDYLQTRWLDETLYGLWTDVQKLMSLQLQYPRKDIFGNIKKYQEMLLTNLTMPIDKIQSRDVSKFQQEKKKQDVKRQQWIDRLINTGQ